MTHDPNFLPPDLQERILKAGFPENSCVHIFLNQTSTRLLTKKKITWTAAMIWLNETIPYCIPMELHSDYNGIIEIDFDRTVHHSWHDTIDRALKIVEDGKTL